MGNIFKKVEEFIKVKNLIEENDRILLAVSGGPDSTLLFHFFINFLKKKKIEIKVAYIHHHLRKEAERELEFVKNLSLKYGIQFFSGDIEIDEKRNIEKKLREKRYEKLYEIAEKTKCNKIATGHTLDDHIETFFINLFRGSGISGLCGIWAKSKVFPNSEIYVIRPLLSIERKEILEYLENNKIEYMIDITNFLPNFTRNKIRNEILPFLLKYKPSLKKNILRTTDILQAEEEFLKIYTENVIREILKIKKSKIIIETEKFKKLEKSLKRRIAGYIFKEIKKTPYVDFFKIEKIVNFIEDGINLFDNSILEEILKGKKEKKAFFFKIEIPGKIEIGEKFVIESEFVKFSDEIFRNSNRFTGYFDFSKIKGKIIVRNRKKGDKFKPLGMNVEKRLSRFMIDKKIPENIRDEILIFENNGKIMWVCGYEISEEFKVEKNTEKIIKISVKPKNLQNIL